MDLIPLLRPYLRRQRRALAIGLFVSVLGAVVGSLVPLILRQAVDDLEQRGVAPGQLVSYSLLMLLVALVEMVLTYLRRMSFGVASYDVEFELRGTLFRQLTTLDQGFYGRTHTGDLMARATNDLSAIRQFLGPGLSSLATALSVMVAATALLLAVNWRLALVVMGLLPVTSLIFTLLGWRMRRLYGAVQDQFGQLSTRAQENLSGIRTIKAYAQEPAEVAAFALANEEYRRLNLRYVLLSGLLWPAMLLVLGIVGALVLFLGGRMVASDTMRLGDLVLFVTYLGLLSWPVIALGWTVTLYQQAAASAARLAEVFDERPAIADPPAAAMAALPTDIAVAFRGVSLTLGGQEVLRDVTLDIPAGSSLALVGPTGVGKSMLVGLLGRVRDPDAGQVLIGGVDVRMLPLSELRRLIGYVPQDPFLFSLPLRQNLLFGSESGLADAEQRVAEALEVSQLVNDMPQLPQGLDTLIGERGVTLSGGQKQRATIARAVLRDPQVLVLDDALSSVDTYTAARILERLRAFMRGRTSIIISQRIATAREADQIAVLEEGQIVERGSHRSLLALGGRYASMYRRELLHSELEL